MDDSKNILQQQKEDIEFSVKCIIITVYLFS